jgi:hypothetical protein
MKRIAPLTLASKQSLELKPTLNAEWPETAPSMDTTAERRGAILISGGKNNIITADSLLKQLATMDITSQNQRKVSSYRTLLKKRAHSRRKNRVAIFDNKIMRTLSRDSSCIQVEPLVLLIEDSDTNMAAAV